MFSIYINGKFNDLGKCIYDDTTPLEEFKVTSPNLKLADNSAGSLTFTIPKTNAFYDEILRMQSEITVYRECETDPGYKEIWSGRAISEKDDFWNNRAITCEGELAYLNDSIQPYHEFTDESELGISIGTFLEYLTDIHNNQVNWDEYERGKKYEKGSIIFTSDNYGVRYWRALKDTNDDPRMFKNNGPWEQTSFNKKFAVGLVTDTDDEGKQITLPEFKMEYESTLECINKYLIDVVGGHIYITKENGMRKINYTCKDHLEINDQSINFGENILDFAKNYDDTEVATVIMPLGATQNDGSRVVINESNPFIEIESASNKYGRIVKTVTFDEITEPEELLEEANKYIETLKYENLTLEVTAFDLNFKDKTKYQDIKVLDLIQCISLPHGVYPEYFPVKEIDIPMDNLSGIKYTLGQDKQESITSRTHSDTIELKNDIEKSSSTALEEAKKEASDLINKNLNGYITIETDTKDGHSEALYISSTQELDKESGSYWKWNSGGLGYFHNGTQSYATAAITKDGEICANYITTGTMSANRIRTGLLVSSDDNEYPNVVFDLNEGTLDIKSGSISLGYDSDIGNYAFYANDNSCTIGGFEIEGNTISGLDMVLNSEKGIDFYKGETHLGYQGTSRWIEQEKDGDTEYYTNNIGLNFNLEYSSSNESAYKPAFISWGHRDNSIDSYYSVKLMYTAEELIWNGRTWNSWKQQYEYTETKYEANTLNVCCTMDMHNNTIKNGWLDIGYNKGGSHRVRDLNGGIVSGLTYRSSSSDNAVIQPFYIAVYDHNNTSSIPDRMMHVRLANGVIFSGD